MNTPANPFQSVVTLGKLQKIHGYDPFYRNNRLILSGIVLVGMFACLCLPMFVIVKEDMQKPSASSDISPVFLTGVFLMFVLLGLVIIYQSIIQWWRARNFSVATFDLGLAVHEGNGTVQIIPWTSIQDVREHIYRKRFREYVVNTVSGKSYLLHRSLKDVVQLGNLVKQNVGNRVS